MMRLQNGYLVGIVCSLVVWLLVSNSSLTFAQCPPSHPRDCGDGWCCYNGPPPCEILKLEGGCVQANPTTSTSTTSTSTTSTPQSTTSSIVNSSSSTSTPSTTTSNVECGVYEIGCLDFEGTYTCCNASEYDCCDGYGCCHLLYGECSEGVCSEVLCPFLIIYTEGSDEVDLLRTYRDKVLSKTKHGREIIRLYYEWSPVVVNAMEEDEELKQEVRKFINEVLPMIEEVVR